MSLYGAGTKLSGNAITFADQVINLFTTYIGNWVYVFIAVSVFVTLYSACLTQHDAVSRVSIDVFRLLVGEYKKYADKKYYAIGIVSIAVMSIVVLYALGIEVDSPQPDEGGART